MHDAVPTERAASPPTAIFRRELGAAAAREGARKVLNPDKKAALASLRDDDLGELITAFESLLHGPADLVALTDELYGALRALSPAAMVRGNDA